MFTLYFNFGISNVEIKTKYGLLSNHLFQRKQKHDGSLKNLRAMINFHKKIIPSSYHKEEKTLIELSCVNNIGSGEKDFSSYYTFEGL